MMMMMMMMIRAWNVIIRKRLMGQQKEGTPIDLLKHGEIPEGVAYIRSKMDEAGCRAKLDSFWRYFTKNWMKKSCDDEDKDAGR